jgi:hypothetical protein
MNRRYGIGLTLLVAILLSGCQPKHVSVPRLKTMPVTGTVHVDGEPALGVTVQCCPKPGSAEIQHPVLAVTDAEGNFAFAMYEAGDGLPEGTYNLVFLWEFGMDQTDKLKGAYADPTKSRHVIEVVDGEEQDLGVIELSSKGPG